MSINDDGVFWNTNGSANNMVTYPQYGGGEVEKVVTVTETFYDEEGRITKEIITETRTTTKPNYPYYSYTVST